MINYHHELFVNQHQFISYIIRLDLYKLTKDVVHTVTVV